MSGKPPYKVPPMREIEAIPWNGFNVVSTFSGGGGSCLGYRMAGFRVLYANEFVEEAQRTYKANHPKSYLDTRDIRQVKPDDILDIIGMKRGELDLFDGSPPCCAFSTCGSKEKGWGSQRDYSDGKKQRVDDLFLEYIRILDGLQPKVFIAENVSGLVKGTAKGYFKDFISTMKSCGYQVKAALLNAAWLGVPQSRERIIFCGVRNDISDMGIYPSFPAPLKYQYSLFDAISDVHNEDEELNMLNEAMSKYKIGEILKKIPRNPKKPIGADEYMGGSYFNLVRESMYKPCGTVCQRHGELNVAGICHPLEDRKFTVSELKRITSIPDDFILTGTYSQQWERLGRMVPPVMMKHIAENVRDNILCKITSK